MSPKDGPPTDCAVAQRGELGRADDAVARALTAQLRQLNAKLLEESRQRIGAESELQRATERLDLTVGELHRLSRSIFQLAELGNLLQACEGPEEAFTVIAETAGTILAGLSGVVYLFDASRHVLEAKARWGTPATSDNMPPSDCWGLRRGRVHAVDAEAAELSCAHISRRTGDSICIPLAARGETIGMLYVTGHRLEDPENAKRHLREDGRRLAVVVGEQIELAIANLQLRETLRAQALRDPLTQLYNRRFVEDWLGQEVDRANRSVSPLSVLMLDIDSFKLFNDTNGHDAGDRLLTAIADILRQTVRTGDVVCRYGGEEFLILCPGATLATSAARAEQLRAAVEGARIEHVDPSLPGVTVSVGVAVYPDHSGDPLDVISAADAALYTAKRAGRNRVVTAPLPDRPDGEVSTAA